ncbi:hypothetical protein P389DRAFT_167037 [Cystobasidium minutum MCA 4210]|uniref:uncharacterized protein n=1 Tax=Cystobasidium minutum MCA 4210 TaxID=1397322 RepID=UPI0034CEA64C|eukprot:jgi/Rhomi1/167037/fgenesh1_kg.2_\
MSAAGDSDNESVLSSLPSSPAADEQEEERDEDNFSQSEEEEDENQSDAETEPLPPTSSAARARQNRTSGSASNSRKRAILQTDSSSSEPELAENGKQSRKRDTLAVPSNSTSQLAASATSPKSRRMSFDDGSDLSALTSEAEDGHIEDDEEEDDVDNNDGGPTPRAARRNAAGSSSSSRNKAKRNVIGQQRQRQRNGAGDTADHEDDSEEQDYHDHQLDNGQTSSMDEGDDDDEEEYEEDEEGERGEAGSANADRHGRGRGRPPRRQNALAAAAKRAAARTSSHNRTKDEDESDDGDSQHRSKKEPHGTDEDDHDGQGQRKAKAEQLDAAGLNDVDHPTAGEDDEDDDDDELDPDEQLQRDMMADEAEELAKAARTLDDSDDEDYMDPSAPRSRSQQHTSARRRGQIHSGTAKNATRRTATGYNAGDSPKRANASLSTPSSSNAKLPPSPSRRSSGGKAPNSATSNASSSRKRGTNSAKRGAAGRAAAAALRNSASGARHDTEDDDDHMDIDSQAHESEDDVDSDGTAHKDEEHDTSLGGSAQITVTDVNGKTEHGEGNFMSGSSMSLPGSVAASAAALSNLNNVDTEDAMSGISEDVPILLKATEQAQAQAAAAASGSAIPRLSISTTAAEAGASGSISRETATPEDDTTAPSTPLLPVPSQGLPGSAGRRKSPASEGSGVGARGRGRGARGGFIRGRGKKGAQARMLAAHGDDDEVSTSAAEDHDREGSPGHETGAGSDHEEDTGDASAAKKRQEAIEALTKIEIEFAQLRDKMYLEKMEEVAKERWQIENDVHPESIHLMHLVEHRRTARLELARKNHKVAEAANLRAAESNVRYCWSQWMRRRHDLIREIVDDMNQKRRRLDREKRAIERPRNEELSTILRIHAPPPYMFFEKKHPLSYGREYSLEYEVAESLQKKRKRGAAGLDHDEAMYDLERMGLRDPYRGNYPPHYHYDPAYAVGPPVAGPSRLPGQQEVASRPPYSGYPFEGPHPAQHGGPMGFPQQSHIHPSHASISPSNNPLAAAQGRTVASVSQQAPAGIGGRSDPFSAYRMQTPSGTPTPGGTPGSMHVQAQSIAQPMRPPSGPRPTLDDHLGYSTTTGQSRPPSVPQAARPGQRFDYPTVSKGAGELPSNKFLPSYYGALGVQRT